MMFLTTKSSDPVLSPFSLDTDSPRSSGTKPACTPVKVTRSHPARTAAHFRQQTKVKVSP